MKRTAFLASTAALAACSTNTSPPRPYLATQQTVLNGVTIVNTRDGTLATNMTIVTDRGRITKIGPTGSVSGSSTATVVDATGAFVVPGFNDLHTHPLNSSDPQGALTLMLANGVTGFRQMSGSPDLLAARASGSLMQVGQPELLEMPGDILTPGNAGTVDAAIQQVQVQQAQGADFIKVVGLAGAPFQAALSECARRGIRFIGHLSANLDIRAAVDAGMRSIEHLGPRDALLLGCSSQEAAIRQQMAQTPPGPPPSGPPAPNVITNQIVLPTLFTAPAEFARYQQVVDSYSDARMQELAGHFVQAQAWTIPTLLRLRTMEITTDSSYSGDPNLQYVPAPTLALWRSLALQFQQQISPMAQASLRALYDLQMRVVRPLKSAGVAMMTGSDFGGEWVIPGFGLHQEFDMLAQAGLTPLEVLQMTTLNGAQFLGREATMGTVEVGKNANLVLLSANPIQSVANLHSIAGVVRNGTYYSNGALTALKAAVRQRLVGWNPPAAAAHTCCSVYA